MFSGFDGNEDGKLTKDEIVAYMKKMDKENGTDTYSEEKVTEMFGKASVALTRVVDRCQRSL